MEALPGMAIVTFQHVISILVNRLLFLDLSKKWFRNFAQGDKWNFCLTAGTLVPANQERP
jgi:hypothetical protein